MRQQHAESDRPRTARWRAGGGAATLQIGVGGRACGVVAADTREMQFMLRSFAKAILPQSVRKRMRTSLASLFTQAGAAQELIQRQDDMLMLLERRFEARLQDLEREISVLRRRLDSHAAETETGQSSKAES